MAAGLWLLAAPSLLAYGALASLNDRIIGPLIAAFAVIAIWDTNRVLRHANTLLGIWLVAAPWVLGYQGAAIVNSSGAGVIVIAASLIPGYTAHGTVSAWTSIPLPWRKFRRVPSPLDRSRSPATSPAQGATGSILAASPQKAEKLPMTTSSLSPGLEPALDARKSGEVVVITGASAGVGRATARTFARRGASIGLVARGVDRLEATQQEIESLGGRALVLPTDVADADQVEAAATRVEQVFGPIDIWVNNAMVSVFSPVKKMQPEEFKRVTEVTYLGYVYGTLAALKRMLPRDHGGIILVGSALAYRGIPLQAAYCGAKHAIEGFRDSLRTELLHDHSKVQLTMVQLPAVNTPQFRWVKSRLPNKAQPVPPIFEPELIADAIVWAAQHPRREVIVGGSSLQAILVGKLLPAFGDWYLARTGFQAQQTDEPRDPDRPNNLWQPVPGDQGARGVFTDRAHMTSLQFRFAKHRRVLAGVLGGLTALLATALLLRANE